MESPTSFAALLRRSRRAANLTQEALAERAGVSSRTISDLERGIVRAPRADTLILLANALGMPASERQEWEALRKRLSRRGSSSRTATGPVTGNRGSFWNVPVALNALVGRQDEVAVVTAALRQEDVRLLTLTGVGGVGKTRLAMAVAERLRDGFAGGIAFVDLAPLRDPGQMLAAVAASLHIQEVAGVALRDRLAEYLTGRPFLLVLDNFEQIVDVAPEVTDLLTRCPDLTALVTSRIPLKVQGERLFPVDPLAFPPTPERARAVDVSRSDAPALFVQRARASNPRFEATDDNAGAILEICRRLDGLPLAIELAAARTTVLPPDRLLGHLERRLPLLTGGPRDAPERQRTLRTAIAWSYDLLEPEQQALFCELSVCAGGWSLDAAGAIASGSVHQGDDVELLNALMALIDHHLVRQVAGADFRFTMLETVREFGRDQLAQRGDAEDIQRRHADYFLALAERCNDLIEGPELVIALQQYEEEHDNLLAALGWLRDQADAVRAMRLAAMLGRFWFNRSYYSLGRTEIASVLALPGADRRGEVRGDLLRAAAWLHAWQGEYSTAIAMSSEAIANWEEAGYRDDLADAYVILGIALGFDGDMDEAVRAWERAVDIAEEQGDQASLARARSNLGYLAQTQGDDERAAELLRQALASARASGNPATIELVAGNLASLLRERGELAEAEQLFRETLALHQRLEMGWSMASELESLAHFLHQRGRPADAAQLIGAAGAIRDTIGVPVQPVTRPAYDALVTALEAALGDTFESAWNAGSGLTFEEAIQLGLAESDE